MPRPPIAFDEELPRLSQLVAEVQRTLRAAMDGIVTDASGARAFARTLGLTRSLGWAFWNLAFAADVPSALRALPGDRGWMLLYTGLTRRGCAESRTAQLSHAVALLIREMNSRELHPTLLRSLASGALDTQVEIKRMRAARKKAREATEVLYGIRCDITCAAILVGAPTKGGIVDTSGVVVFEGLERTRPGPAWPIFEGQLHYGVKQTEAASLERSAIGWAIDRHCSRGTVGTALRPSTTSDYLISFIDTGTAPKGGIRAAFGQHVARAGRVPLQSTPGTISELPHLSMITTVPTRIAVFDMLLHEDVSVHAIPSGALYGPPDPWPTLDASHGMPNRLEAKRLNLDDVVEIPKPTTPPAKSKSLRPVWTELLELAAKSLGQPMARFRRFRLTVENPPMHGRILMRWAP